MEELTVREMKRQNREVHLKNTTEREIKRYGATFPPGGVVVTVTMNLHKIGLLESLGVVECQPCGADLGAEEEVEDTGFIPDSEGDEEE